MANAVIMPKAGITVESCIIGEWLKNVGDQINVGDILFTYETDKASFECESTAAGTLLEIFYEAGDEVPCLLNVCAIGNPGEDVSALKGGAASTDAPAEAPAAAPAAAAPAAAPAAAAVTAAGETVTAPMPGNILKIVAQQGQKVNEGDVIMILEAMKMENEIVATKSGTIAQIVVSKGATVDTGAALAVIA